MSRLERHEYHAMNLKPVPLRDRVVVVCILRDITQRKSAAISSNVIQRTPSWPLM